MQTLKVNFLFSTTANTATVKANLKQALEALDAYNTQHTVESNLNYLDCEVLIEDSVKATTADVKEVLEAFINSVDAYNVNLNTTSKFSVNKALA
jgi:hypothetical protein